MFINHYNFRDAHYRTVDGQIKREHAQLYWKGAKLNILQWPFTPKLLGRFAKTYNDEAAWHDIHANIRKGQNN